MNTLRLNLLFVFSGLVGSLILNGGIARAELVPASPESSTADASISIAPFPGTTTTSAAALEVETLTVQAAPPEGPATPADVIPTRETTNVGQATRSGPSYVGIGGNIGLGGSSDLGRGSFAAFSKIGITNYLSARPAILVRRDPAILLPVTFDFPIRSEFNDRIRFAPYVGGGVVVSTGGGSAVRGLLTGGIDIPFADRFTATANVNVGFFDNTEVGLVLGVGYNFR